jgi:hypothetical protein
MEYLTKEESMDIAMIIAKIVAYAPIVTAVIAVASAIAAITPSKSDDRIVQLVLDIVNKLGLNVGKATNKDA